MPSFLKDITLFYSEGDNICDFLHNVGGIMEYRVEKKDHYVLYNFPNYFEEDLYEI